MSFQDWFRKRWSAFVVHEQPPWRRLRMAKGSSPQLLISRVLDLQPHEALLLAALPGAVLFLGSVLMDIDHLPTPAEAKYSAVNFSREVGYIPALNWSVTYLLLFPEHRSRSSGFVSREFTVTSK